MLKQVSEYFVVGCIAFGLFLPIVIQGGSMVSEQHFIYLAQSFLEGHAYLPEMYVSFNKLDYVFYNGSYFWPQAPFAAVVLMPFVKFFGVGFLQGYVHVGLVIAVALLVNAVARSFSFGPRTRMYFMFAFLFGSVLYGVAAVPWSFYFAQLLSITLLLLAIYLYRTHQSWFLIGLVLGCAIATRYTLIVAPLFFVLHILLKGESMKYKLRNLAALSIPLLAVGFILASYNYVRFDSFFETGYSFAQLGGNDQFNFNKYALFDVRNIPSNLYYYFLKMPEPILEDGSLHLIFPYIKGSIVSLSFLIVAPFFLYAFSSFRESGKENTALWIVIAFQLLLVLSYYSPGMAQYLGPRYMLDVMPWLLLAVLIAFEGRAFALKHKLLIVGSGTVNFYLLFSVLANG